MHAAGHFLQFRTALKRMDADRFDRVGQYDRLQRGEIGKREGIDRCESFFKDDLLDCVVGVTAVNIPVGIVAGAEHGNLYRIAAKLCRDAQRGARLFGFVAVEEIDHIGHLFPDRRVVLVAGQDIYDPIDKMFGDCQVRVVRIEGAKGGVIRRDFFPVHRAPVMVAAILGSRPGAIVVGIRGVVIVVILPVRPIIGRKRQRLPGFGLCSVGGLHCCGRRFRVVRRGLGCGRHQHTGTQQQAKQQINKMFHRNRSFSRFLAEGLPQLYCRTESSQGCYRNMNNV